MVNTSKHGESPVAATDERLSEAGFDQELVSVLTLACSRLLDLSDADSVTVELMDGDPLYCRAAVGAVTPVLGAQLPPSGSALSALQSGQVQHVHEDGDGSVPGTLRRTAVVAPLPKECRRVGVVRWLYQESRAIVERDIRQARILAETLGTTLELHHVSQRRRASEAQYSRLFYRNPLPMYVSDFRTGRILFINDSMVRHYEYTESELLSMSVNDLYAKQGSQGGAASITPMEKISRSGGVNQRHITKSGRALDVEVWADTFEFGRRSAHLVLIYDVTDRLRTERKLAQVSRAQRMLSECNEALMRTHSEESLLHEICSIAAGIGGYTLAFVGYTQPDERKSVAIVASAGVGDCFLPDLDLSWSADCDKGRGPTGRAIRSGQPVVIEDIADSPVLPHDVGQILAEGHRGAVSLPLRLDGLTFGVLNLLSPEVLVMGAEEMKLLKDLANDLAFGIANLRMQVKERRNQLAIVKVAATVSAVGSEFFVQLAGHMADALGAHAGFVARLDPHGTHMARTLGAVIQGDIRPDFDVALAGTAFENLQEAVEWRVTHDGSNPLSKPHFLAAIGADSCVARRLDNSAGNPIGFIVVAFSEGLQDPDFIASTLTIFAARAASEMERQESDARIRDQASYLDKAQEAIIVRGMDDRVQYWNKSAERLYGWTSEEAFGRRLSELLSIPTERYASACDSLFAHGEWQGEIVKHRKNGRELSIETGWTLIRDDADLPKAVLVIDTDVTERRAADLKIKKLAYFDVLTGLPNRRLLQDRLQQALLAAEGNRQGGAVLLIDLDNFKSINDAWGHDKGDLLLQEVANRLRTYVRETDTVARFGGDEFVVLLTALPSSVEKISVQAERVAAKILHGLNAPCVVDGIECRGGSSIGIATFSGEAATVHDLLKQADMAMYASKSAGRNTVRFFDVTLQAVATDRAELDADLRQALIQGEFFMNYQPQVNSQGAVIGVEALVRWLSPRRGLVSPATFIPFCEETGLILGLGRLVLEMACRTLASWKSRSGFSCLTMAVNVSTRQFLQEDFAEQVEEVLGRTGANPCRLKLELTESVLVDDMDAVIEKMAIIKAMGVSLSLDDFGTGYSSLSYLKKLPLDQLKIDQSFVRNILTDANDATLAKTVIGLGHSFGLEILAEGVEDQAQCEFLARHGCHVYQGYLFSQPLAIDVLEAWLEKMNGCLVGFDKAVPFVAEG